MRATLNFIVETTSVQKAASLRDRCAEWLNADDDVTVINQDMGQIQNRWTVKGVEVTTREPFTETVEADDADAAKAKVTTAKKVVVSVEREL